MKSKATEKTCLCEKCPLRFSCFTAERIFSSPLYQGLYEALIAQGRSKEDALTEVTKELKGRIGMDNVPYVTPANPYVYPYTASPFWTSTTDSNTSVSNFTYTMLTGEKVLWSSCAKL